jgi:hypothetical protein
MDVKRSSNLQRMLCDSRAYRTFLYAAWCMVPLALVVLIALTPMYDVLIANPLVRGGFQIVSGLIGAIGAVAGIVIFLGMPAYLFFLDQRSWKLLWLIVFLFSACFGSSIYFFTVYRKQVTGV